MSSLLQSVLENLREDQVSTMSSQLNADKDSTKKAIATALPALIGALSRHGSDQDGAASLLSILDRNADGSVLDDLSGFLGGKQYQEPKHSEEILREVLGDKQTRVQRNVGKSSGLNPDAVSQLLKMLAPIVMASLLRHKESGNLDKESTARSDAARKRPIREAARRIAGQDLGSRCRRRL